MKPADRDAQLRGSFIVHAHLAEARDANGWATCSKLAIAARDEDRNGVDDEGHAARLIDDLIELQLLDEKSPTDRGVAKRELRHRLVRLSAKGRDWYWGRLDPIPGVEHWRHQ